MKNVLWTLWLLVFVSVACSDGGGGDEDTDSTTDVTDTDTDTDSDTDTDTDSDTETGDTETDCTDWPARNQYNWIGKPAIVPASDGSVYVLASFTGTFQINGQPEENKSVIGRIAGGEWVWMETFNPGIRIAGIAVTEQDALIVVGAASDPVTVGSGPNQLALNPGDGAQYFLLEYDMAGNLSWAKPAAQTSNSPDHAEIILDPDGTIYLNGRFRGDIVLGAGSHTETLGPADDKRGWLAGYSPTGDLKWAEELPSAESRTWTTWSWTTEGGGLTAASKFTDGALLGSGATAIPLHTGGGLDTGTFVANWNSDGTLESAFVAGSGVLPAKKVVPNSGGGHSLLLLLLNGEEILLGNGTDDISFESPYANNLVLAEYGPDGALTEIRRLLATDSNNPFYGTSYETTHDAILVELDGPDYFLENTVHVCADGTIALGATLRTYFSPVPLIPASNVELAIGDDALLWTPKIGQAANMNAAAVDGRVFNDKAEKNIHG